MHKKPCEKCNANVHLIDAASDMLEALHKVERAWFGDGIEMSTAVDSVLLAITKATTPTHKKSCESCEKCNTGIYYTNAICGCDICCDCEDHRGLVRCFCGWAADGGDGRQQLLNMGETIESEDC